MTQIESKMQHGSLKSNNTYLTKTLSENDVRVSISQFFFEATITLISGHFKKIIEQY